MNAPLPPNESERLAALASYDILDTPPEKAFDDLTRFVADLFEVQVCAVTLIDETRQWFKSIVGYEITEFPREWTLCTHTILNPTQVMVVEDATKDARFFDNVMVKSEEVRLRFYAGAPLATAEGLSLGTVCVMDQRPRSITLAQQGILKNVATQIVSQLELRKALAAQTKVAEDYAKSEQRLSRAQSVAGAGSWEYNLAEKMLSWSLKTYEIFGFDPSKGAPLLEEVMHRYHPEDVVVLRKAIQLAISEGKPYQLDLRIRRGSGYLHVQSNGEVVFNEDGVPTMLVGTVLDISSRKFAEVRLQRHAAEVERLLYSVQSEAERAEEMAKNFEYAAKRFESLFFGLPVACMGIDTKGAIIEWNNVSSSLFGYAPEEALFKNFVDLLVPEEDRQRMKRAFRRQIAGGGSSPTQERRLITQNGDDVWVLCTSLPLSNPEGELVGIICSHVDITGRVLAEAEVMDSRRQILEQHRELERAHRTLEALANSDGLTCLKNHRAFQEFLQAEFLSSKANDENLSLIMLDVDHFKAYNDTYGHPAGDQVLRDVARLIEGAVHTDDFVARYGGEEFVAVLPGTDINVAALAAERIRVAIESEPWANRAITVSVGVATVDPTSKTAIETKSQLLQLADEALYCSKRNGRNQVTLSGSGAGSSKSALKTGKAKAA